MIKNTLIPNGQIIIFNFPAGAGGKMLQNCVGLSRYCVLNHHSALEWQVNYNQPLTDEFYDQKMQWILATVPLGKNCLIDWLAFEIDKDQPHGMGFRGFQIDKLPIANQDYYRAAELGLWATISVHNYESFYHYTQYWPTVRHVCLINNVHFTKKSLSVKNKNLNFDESWSTLGITPQDIGFNFDVDNCIYNTNSFVDQVSDLYKFLEFDDFRPELIARYHSQYIKLHD